jgi:hypothetical protein
VGRKRSALDIILNVLNKPGKILVRKRAQAAESYREENNIFAIQLQQLIPSWLAILRKFSDVVIDSSNGQIGTLFHEVRDRSEPL